MSDGTGPSTAAQQTVHAAPPAVLGGDQTTRPGLRTLRTYAPGKFRHAHGTGTGGGRGRGVAPRNPDGTCSQQDALILEVDLIFSHGTLSL